MPGRWFPYRHRAFYFRIKLRAAHRLPRRGPDDDPIYRHSPLLDTGRADRRISMGRLAASAYRHRHIYCYPKFGRPFLRAADRRQFCWPTSDDRDRLDICLGFADWGFAGSDPRCAANGNNKGAAGPLCLGRAFARRSHGNNRGSAGSRGSRSRASRSVTCGQKGQTHSAQTHSHFQRHQTPKASPKHCIHGCGDYRRRCGGCSSHRLRSGDL